MKGKNKLWHESEWLVSDCCNAKLSFEDHGTKAWFTCLNCGHSMCGTHRKGSVGKVAKGVERQRVACSSDCSQSERTKDARKGTPNLDSASARTLAQNTTWVCDWCGKGEPCTLILPDTTYDNPTYCPYGANEEGAFWSREPVYMKDIRKGNLTKSFPKLQSPKERLKEIDTNLLAERFKLVDCAKAVGEKNGIHTSLSWFHWRLERLIQDCNNQMVLDSDKRLVKGHRLGLRVAITLISDLLTEVSDER